MRFSLELQTAFGLRREEAIKFRVAYADRGDRIQLKDTWCKGGRARSVPVLEGAQRELLDRLHAFAGKDSLIRPEEKYVQQKGRFRARHAPRRDPEDAPPAARLRAAAVPRVGRGFRVPQRAARWCGR